jgi:hypothetical protein
VTCSIAAGLATGTPLMAPLVGNRSRLSVGHGLGMDSCWLVTRWGCRWPCP